MIRKVAIEIISFLFIFLFVYAAVSKLADLQKFQVQIGKSPMLADIAAFVAWFIPVVEILVAGMLAIPRLRLVGLYASFSLMTMFTLYITAILKLSDHVPCSCGGILESMGWTEHLIFNASFVLLGFASVLLYSTHGSDTRAIDSQKAEIATAKKTLLQQNQGNPKTCRKE